jgi:hypothetical protein
VYDKYNDTPLHFAIEQKGRNYMSHISKEYVLLFNIISDTAQALRQLQDALVLAQQQAEELFMNEQDDNNIQESA